MILEICVDNLESFNTAVASGADRIELCSALSEGGLTPSYGFMEVALRSSVPTFMMVRPRGCDFLYSSDEIEMMLRDIYHIKQLNALGVVFGALDENANLNMDAMKALVKASGNMKMTLHRAIDQSQDAFETLDAIMSLGMHRVLTTGQKNNVVEGTQTLAKMKKFVGNKLAIMAGGGVKADTIENVIQQTRVDEIHASATTNRNSKMKFILADSKMGSDNNDNSGDDFKLNVVDPQIVRNLKNIAQRY